MPPQVIIELSRSSLAPSRLLLPADMTTGTDPRLDALPPEIRRGRMYVPAVEAIHIGPIPTKAFTGFILIARGDSGQRLWRSFPVSAVDELYMTAQGWSKNNEAAKAERHARGDLTIAERLSRESAPARQRTADEILQLRKELRETFGLDDDNQDEKP
jgi:hypothetical protein